MGGRAVFGLISLLLSASCAEPSSLWRPAGVSHTLTIALDPAAPLRLAYTLTDLESDRTLSWSRARTAAGDAQEGDLACLTAAVYYEARSESDDGQRAVAQVVLNRVNRPSFAPTVCGVVRQRGAGGCQFRFTCDGSQRARHEQRAWAEAGRIARAALAGAVFRSIGQATFYHTAAVAPDWSGRMTRVATIGAHIFYRSRTS